ncbi:hypothetical protein [Evansella clarkii]|uniref:hypothetical protein n=1 Tax=Evansella clarkii TaxID=79879 RepID=UPI0011165526|nr:hypothetical protein [Evansella clarkii]
MMMRANAIWKRYKLWRIKKITIPYLVVELPERRMRLLRRQEELHKELKEIAEQLKENEELQEKLNRIRDLV